MLSYYRGYTSDFKHINPCKTGVIDKIIYNYLSRHTLLLKWANPYVYLHLIARNNLLVIGVKLLVL